MGSGPTLVAVVDTSVLMKAGLLEFAVRLHKARACYLRWSESINDELQTRIARRPVDAAQRISAAMAKVEDAVIVVDGDHMAVAVGMVRDPNDEHVSAAALAARQVVDEDPDVWGSPTMVLLVTANRRDFDLDAHRSQGIEVLEPDEFGCRVFELHPKAALTSVDPHRAAGLLAKMRLDGMVATADAIEEVFHELDVL